MEKPLLPDIAQDLVNALHKQGALYLTLKQLVAALPVGSRQRLGLTRQATASEILQQLAPFLGDQLQVYREATSTCIGYKMPVEDLILAQVHKQAGLSPVQLGKRLPVLRTSYIPALNTLLTTGVLVCTFTDKQAPTLNVARHTPSQAEPDVVLLKARQAFRAAYEQVGQGRSFVRIHRLREALPWSRERFDDVLLDLMADYTIEIHGGDPSVMTDVERHSSFVDTHGTLYIALSWRGNT